MSSTRQPSPISYQARADEIREHSNKRMGYPVMGPTTGKFTLFGWERDRSENAERLVNTKDLGVVPNSPADTLMINIGGQLLVNTDNANLPRSGAWQAEIDILHRLARHFNLAEEQIRGYVTSGGTEANLACLWWLREYLTSEDKKTPVLFVSDQSHYSIKKAANILGIKMRVIASDLNGNIDLEELSAQLTQHMHVLADTPIIMCATAGTTQLGGIDNLPLIRKCLERLVKEKGGFYAIHLDAALLGLTLPYHPYLADNTLFNLVDTVTISGHKFIGTTLISGVALTKKEIMAKGCEHKEIEVGYVNNIQDTTISGSRSGLIVMEMHNALCTLQVGDKATKLQKLILQCSENAVYLKKCLEEKLGSDKVIHNPHQFTVVFPRPTSKNSADYLEDKYGLMSVEKERFGICVMPTVDKILIDEFLADYESLIKSIQSSPNTRKF